MRMMEVNTMYYHSVTMNNYKSFGDAQAEIIIEPGITAVIGKNESGKSNIIDALSEINLGSNMNTTFVANKLNRKESDIEAMSFIIVLKPTREELDEGTITADTEIVINKNGTKITGGLLEFYNRTARAEFNVLFSMLGDNPFRLSSSDLSIYRGYEKIVNNEQIINVIMNNQMIEYMGRFIDISNSENREAWKKQLEKSQQQWNRVYKSIPKIFHRRDNKILKQEYVFDDVKKELGGVAGYSNSLLSDFVKLIGINKSDFILAAQGGITSQQISARSKIKRKLNNTINKEFSDFYSTEPIELSIDFNGGVVYFSVRSSEGEDLYLNERSDGLRWLLNTFIDARANEIKDCKVLYLFDEPGTGLHVNAQKELIKLFHYLADKGNQIVYTTHSPYMLDVDDNGIHRIRAVVKEENGNTLIYKTAYDSRIAPEYQSDTLAPIIRALGMSIGDTFGPALNKTNIVCEGTSDYVYLVAMAKYIGFDMSNIVFIPSVGATNCVNICSILKGWGCRYLAVFDYDQEGVEKGGKKLEESIIGELNREYLYLKDVSKEEIENKTYKSERLTIEDLITNSELERFKAENTLTDIGKTLIAKLFSDALENGAYECGEECKSNFTSLFKRIKKIIK